MARKNFNKLPSALSEEDLLKQANSAEEILPEAPNNIVSFLLFYNLQPGAFRVKKHFLYRLYLAHVKDYCTPTVFYYEISNYIPSVTSYHVNYFLINKDAFDIGNKTFALIESKKINKQSSPAFNRHFQNFLKAYNLEDGDNWTSTALLFEEYKNWCKSARRKNLINIVNFNKFVTLYFKKERKVKQKKYVGLNIKLYEKKEEK